MAQRRQTDVRTDRQVDMGAGFLLSTFVHCNSQGKKWKTSGKQTGPGLFVLSPCLVTHNSVPGRPIPNFRALEFEDRRILKLQSCGSVGRVSQHHSHTSFDSGPEQDA